MNVRLFLLIMALTWLTGTEIALGVLGPRFDGADTHTTTSLPLARVPMAVGAVPQTSVILNTTDSVSKSLSNATMAPVDFFGEVIETASELGGLSALLRISAVIMLLVASMKVTMIREHLWDKLGEAKVWVAPVLGLIGGILGLGAGGVAVTPALIFTYVTAGSGAVFLHEILDSLKSLPGIGPAYLVIISTVEKSLMGSKSGR